MLRVKTAVIAGKLVSLTCRVLKLGAGVTWAGEVALKVDPQIFSKLIPKTASVVFVAGTNGKTTTAKLLVTALKNAGKTVVTNASGANLLNGMVGSLLTQKSGDIYVLEVDENNLISAMGEVRPHYAEASRGKLIVGLLNIFRDQLDRYGEVDTVAKRWLAGLKLFDANLIINADDPQLAYLGRNLKGKISYFGLDEKKFYLKEKPHAMDSIFCPNCGGRLAYQGYYLSHLGEYRCEKCGFGHPRNDRMYRSYKAYIMDGVHNFYNILAASLAAEILGVKDPDFSRFKPAFGRSEEIWGIKVLLSKNPAGFNESLRTVVNSRNQGSLLLVLNDRIPDGRDVSWIWDADLEMLKSYQYPIYVSGDRKEDLAVRLKYAEIRDMGGVGELGEMLEKKPKWVLATYSGMLEVRKILTGRKIL